jgi:hypothetical protein
MNQEQLAMYNEIKVNNRKSLSYLKCEECTGVGHMTAQCATLRNLDGLMKANPVIKQAWIMEKKEKINRQYHQNKVQAKLIVGRKIQAKASLYNSQATAMQSSIALQEMNLDQN